MKVDIRGGATRQQEGIPFSGKVDLSQLTRYGENPFPEPVQVNGKAKPIAVVGSEGFYQVDYTADFVQCGACARCLANVKLERTMTFSHTAAESEAEDAEWEDFLTLDNGELDVTGMAAADLLLESDEILLCSEDCEGICPVCGKSRNVKEPCECDTSVPDPRFDALRDIMNQSNK